MRKRGISLILCLCLALGLLPISVSAASVAEAGGWNETLWAKLEGVREDQITAVRYTGPVSGTLNDRDLTYLVRTEDGCVRIDIPGLPAGNYTLTVTTATGTLTESGIRVEAQDRSGFAHFGYTAGVGAYRDDGSLKPGTIVLYVTEENKNTVAVTSKDGTTVTGIGNILNSVGMDVGGGRNSKGGKANTNQDILRKLAADGTPLVIRIVGRVTAPEGLTAYDSIDYGGSVGDNGAMARMSGGKDITIEGIGTGAIMDGWGLHFICQTADYAKGWGKSFEVRNLTFRNVPEDCIGMEGQQENSLNAPVERCWIHHCAFYGPTISNPAESDKDGGDGACDFKRGQYFTNSYCYYEGYHKTNLVGSSDTSLQYHITYHHNYWKNCDSRGPLARQADIHMYNNIFEGQTSYCMNPRANAYIFSEFNLFLNSKDPVSVRSGGVKSYGDSFTACSGDNHATVVTDKSAKVSTSCKYANFDTDPAVSYIPAGKYLLQESIPEMKAVVLSQTGPQKSKLLRPEDVNVSNIPTGRYPTAAVKLDYSKNLNSSTVTAKSGVFDNIVFNVSKTASDCITLGGSTSGCDVVFYVSTAVHITVNQHSGSANPVLLCNAAGEAIQVGSGTAKDLPAGYYYLQSNTYDPGTGKYKEAKLAGLTIRAVDPDAATDPIPTVPPTEPTQPSTGGESGGTNPGNPDSGGVEIPAGSYVHNFTEQDKTSTFFAISGNLSTSKGTVAFQGMNLTKCLKMESATEISFTAPTEGTLILVFGGSTSAAGKSVKIDGQTMTIGADHILTVTVQAGNHTVKKGDSINLFYMAYTSSQQPEHQHSYSATVTLEAGCMTKGLRTYHCGCGHSYTEDIPAKGHSYGDWVVVKEATTKENGLRQQTCGGCGDVISETIPMLPDDSGHVHNYICEVTKEGTCTEAGVETYLCDCGAFYTQSIPAEGHDYESTVVDATCAESGSMTYTCNVCGDSYTAVLPATGNHQFDGGVADGNGTVTYTCTVCGHTQTEEPRPTDPTVPAEPTPPATEAPTEGVTEPTAGVTDPTVPGEKPDDEPDQTWIAVPMGLLAVAVILIVIRRRENER